MLFADDLFSLTVPFSFEGLINVSVELLIVEVLLFSSIVVSVITLCLSSYESSKEVTKFLLSLLLIVFSFLKPPKNDGVEISGIREFNE